jgi:hypothetical protein
MVPRRDFAMIKPPQSKADQDSTKFGTIPIYLSFDPSDGAGAVHWLQRLELRFPCHGQHRKARPLFFEDTKTFRPMSHGTVCNRISRLKTQFSRNLDKIYEELI